MGGPRTFHVGGRGNQEDLCVREVKQRGVLGCNPAIATRHACRVTPVTPRLCRKVVAYGVPLTISLSKASLSDSLHSA